MRGTTPCRASSLGLEPKRRKPGKARGQALSERISLDATCEKTVVNRPWLHRFAILLAACTLTLFVTGAFVTSNEERPFYSIGQFHPVAAWTVGILAAGLVVWSWFEKTRAGLRWLGWIVLATVVVEVVLGRAMDSQSPALNAT